MGNRSRDEAIFFLLKRMWKCECEYVTVVLVRVRRALCRFRLFLWTLGIRLTFGTGRLMYVSQSDKAFRSLTERHPRIKTRSTIPETACPTVFVLFVPSSP